MALVLSYKNLPSSTLLSDHISNKFTRVLNKFTLSPEKSRITLAKENKKYVMSFHSKINAHHSIDLQTSSHNHYHNADNLVNKLEKVMIREKTRRRKDLHQKIIHEELNPCDDECEKTI